MVEFDGKILELTAGLGCVLSNFRRPVIFPLERAGELHIISLRRIITEYKRRVAPAPSTHMYNTASTSSLTNRRLAH
jgi:hypothetical protein